MQKRLPSGRRLFFPGSGHLVTIDDLLYGILDIVVEVVKRAPPLGNGLRVKAAMVYIEKTLNERASQT